MALVLLMLGGGCGTVQASSGPVTVVLGAVGPVCARLTGRSQAVGCTAWAPGGGVTIRCPFNDALCLAHEIRHALEPRWEHE